jgi:hypothetical protein
VLAADGTKLLEQHGRTARLTPDADLAQADLEGEFCGDLTGDGTPELVLTERTEGAHCCYTHYVVSLTSPPRRLLVWERGNAGVPLVPVKYRAGRAWQIEGRVVVEPPDPAGELGLSYATMPLVPAVLSLQGDRYLLTSLGFPEAYRKARDSSLSACADSPDACGAVSIWIDSLAVGDWDTEKATLHDARVRRALDRRSAAMKTLLATTLGSEQRPVVPPQ